jgi:hypothetical protein
MNEMNLLDQSTKINHLDFISLHPNLRIEDKALLSAKNLIEKS